MDALVLAGGRGTRLRSRVRDVPKPMASVGGRPFLEHLLDQLDRCGVSRVVLSIGHLGDVVVEHFGDSYRGLEIVYSAEEEPLGTGGAIKRALPLLADSFLVVNGDTSVPVDPGALGRAQGDGEGDGLALTVVEVDDVTRFGSLVVDAGRVVALTEKGGACGRGPINGGAYLVGPSLVRLLQAMPDAFSFERDVLEPWIRERGAPCVTSDGPFIDIGVPEDYDRASRVLGTAVEAAL